VTALEIRAIEPADRDALLAFFRRVPEGDRTFFREDVLAPGVVDRWLDEEGDPRFVAVDGDDVVGYLAVIVQVGWSSHVGEVRVVVDPTRRRRGVGRALARAGLVHALELGLRKVVVQVVADQEPTLAMFSSLGFEPEALLRDHVRDASGQLRDLITMAHLVEETWGAMRTTGIEDLVEG
jgi:L-amino acid N-acyltransferase YncA